jgi:hypothetical protein
MQAIIFQTPLKLQGLETVHTTDFGIIGTSSQNVHCEQSGKTMDGRMKEMH